MKAPLTIAAARGRRAARARRGLSRELLPAGARRARASIARRSLLPAIRPSARGSAALATAWALVLALLVGTACAPIGAGTQGARASPPCGAAEGALAAAQGEAAPVRPFREGPERDEPPAGCVRHCRSADHGLQSAAPRSVFDPGLLLATALPAPPLLLLRSRGGAAPAAATRCGPPRASPRPILHCSLLL